MIWFYQDQTSKIRNEMKYTSGRVKVWNNLFDDANIANRTNWIVQE